jgi:hypothetical protein
MRFIWIIFLISFQQIIAQPANREIVDQSINWFSTSGTIKVSERIGIFWDIHNRFVSSPAGSKSSDPMQHIARFSTDITISKNLTISPIGYGYIWNYRYGKQPNAFENDEHRIYQQVIYKHGIGKFNFNHRLRFEERFLQSRNADGDDLGFGENDQFRIRYRGMISLPIGKTKSGVGTFSLQAYDEFFISFGKQVTFHEPDQNRIFMGIGYQASNAFSFSGGYFYQMLIKANGAKQENNTGLSLSVFYNIDLRKKIE